MAVIPIHIVELFTVALVLLGAYRVFQAQSAEAKSLPGACIDDEAANYSVSEYLPVKTTQDQEPSTEVKAQSDLTDIEPMCHQTVLNNYIGDFF